MIFGEDEERATHLLFEPLDDATVGAQLSSAGTDEDAPWRTHMMGTVRRASPTPVGALNVDAIRGRCGPAIPSDRFYEGLNAIGLTYGPVFRGVQTLWQGKGEVLARVRLPDGVANDGAAPLHPALLDACLHIYPALIDTYGDFATVPAR